MEKETREPIFHKHNLKIKNGEICCEGCYRIGIKEGRTQAISEFKEKLKEAIILNDIYTADELFRVINKTAQEIK